MLAPRDRGQPLKAPLPLPGFGGTATWAEPFPNERRRFFLELGSREQWERRLGRRVGVGQVRTGGGPGRRPGRLGCGVRPGHWAESRGVLARENRGRRWRGPGGGRGGAQAHQAGTGRRGGPGAGLLGVSPALAPASGLAATNERPAHVGEAGGGPAAPGGLAGLSSSLLPPEGRRGSSRRAARLGQLGQLARRRSSAARSLVRPWRQDRRRFVAGAGRGGAERGARARGGRGGLRRGRGGSGRASERRGRAQLRCASEPAGQRGHTDRGQTAPGSRAAAAQLSAAAYLGPRGPRRFWAGGRGEGIAEGSERDSRSWSTDRRVGRLRGGGVDTTGAGGGRPEPAGLGGDPGPRFVSLEYYWRPYVCVSGCFVTG